MSHYECPPRAASPGGQTELPKINVSVEWGGLEAQNIKLVGEVSYDTFTQKRGDARPSM